jgi:Lysophospholipase L1 and related esterases
MTRIRPKVFLQAYGDSLTIGFPFSPLRSWPTLLSTELGTVVISSGENGRLLLEMVEERERHLGGFQASYVTLLGGTNDIYSGFGAEFSLTKMKELAAYVEFQGSTPVICLPPPSLEREIEAELAKYREALREWTNREDKKLLDFDSIFRNESGEILEVLFTDDCHPNTEGYQKMADQATEFFEPLFEGWE